MATGNLEAKAISHRRRRTRTGRVRARAHVTSHYPSTEAVARGGSGGEGASERATAADNGGGICRSQNEKLLLFLPPPLPPLRDLALPSSLPRYVHSCTCSAPSHPSLLSHVSLSLSFSLSLFLPSPMFLPPQLTRERETLSGNNRMVCCEHAKGKPNCTYTCNLTFGAV